MGERYILVAALGAALAFAGGTASAQSPVVPSTQATAFFGAQVAITRIITGAAGKRVFLTNLTIKPAATAVFTLTFGTGTNCGTGTTVFYGPATFAAGDNIQDGDGAGAIAAIPVGQDICVTITTANAPGWLSYAQF